MEAQEIEVKYRVIEQDALLRALADHGVSLSSPVLQEDQAYAPAWWGYGKPKTGVSLGPIRPNVKGFPGRILIRQICSDPKDCMAARI